MTISKIKNRNRFIKPTFHYPPERNRDVKTVEFTYPKYKKFKQLYQQAIDSHKRSFIFEGDEWLTGYARYVIQYLEVQFDIH